MRRRSFLAAIPATALAALACSDGGGGGAIVKIATKSTGSRPSPIVVTPTPVPPPELIASAENVYQGGALLLSLVGQVTDGAVTLLGRTRPLSQGSKSIYAFVGVGTDDPPGPQDVKIAFTLSSGSKGTLIARANILKTAWTLDAIIVSERLAALLDPKIAAEETTILNGVYSKVTNEKLWNGAWNQPVPGAVTTRFGEERSYNGSPPGGHHSGTDIGAPAGAPVLATNNGRVAMARQLRLRGNMVAVDHGGGLYSGYAHLSSFAVAEGQMVEAGELLGYVGSTGLSTGAHLHWEMATAGVLVDAFRFLDGTNGF